MKRSKFTSYRGPQGTASVPRNFLQILGWFLRKLPILVPKVVISPLDRESYVRPRLDTDSGCEYPCWSSRCCSCADDGKAVVRSVTMGCGASTSVEPFCVEELSIDAKVAVNESAEPQPVRHPLETKAMQKQISCECSSDRHTEMNPTPAGASRGGSLALGQTERSRVAKAQQSETCHDAGCSQAFGAWELQSVDGCSTRSPSVSEQAAHTHIPAKSASLNDFEKFYGVANGEKERESPNRLAYSHTSHLASSAKASQGATGTHSDSSTLAGGLVGSTPSKRDIPGTIPFVFIAPPGFFTDLLEKLNEQEQATREEHDDITALPTIWEAH